MQLIVFYCSKYDGPFWIHIFVCHSLSRQLVLLVRRHPWSRVISIARPFTSVRRRCIWNGELLDSFDVVLQVHNIAVPPLITFDCAEFFIDSGPAPLQAVAVAVAARSPRRRADDGCWEPLDSLRLYASVISYKRRRH